MSIPDYESIMLPLLRFAEDHQEHSVWQAIDALASQFKLTQEEQKKLLPSGQQSIFYNRVGWARTYMKQAGILEATRRGYFKISERGLQVLKENPKNIDADYLEQFSEFQEFRKRNRIKSTSAKEILNKGETPVEILETTYQSLRDELSRELLDQIKISSPSLFEKMVVELLVKMGYGGSRKDAGEAVGKRGDEGIDGIIKEDRLGLDVVYIQAKRWDQTTIGRPEIQRFVGALHGQHARKGIFITTSSFSKEANDYARSIDSKIILIDGELLTQYMIDFNIGVSPDRAYEIKKLDTDYFIEE
jgi:restriction system protein